MSFNDILDNHSALKKRKEASARQLDHVKNEFHNCDYLKKLPLSIFCAGSLARMEIGKKSDLDMFVIADATLERSRLKEYTLFANLIGINEKLQFPPFSNDGEYLKIYFIDEIKSRTGSRRDDHENLFTARMLLMLESLPIFHEEKYYDHLNQVVEHYFRDKKGKKSFKPLFLLNDILRYWRTLCLNYEERRHEPQRPWRKKNINLKFSRMLTVAGTVLPLVAKPIGDVADFVSLCKQTPLERLSYGLSLLDDRSLEKNWEEALNIYETFLGWKEDDDVDKYLEGGEQKKTISEYAEKLSIFLYDALTHRNIPFEYRRYLIL